MPMPMSTDFKVYAVCSSVLALQMLLLGAMTAATRARHKGYMNPEDARVSFGGAQLLASEHPDTARVIRAHRNMLETLPLFYALGLVYLVAGAPKLGLIVCSLAFTGARVLHSIVYLKGLQPWRTILFGVSLLALVGMVVMILLTVARA
ncbi:MAG: MAPEG family protein [Myxococcales bacterium]|nr:MAPEG family protein [Myxococcales bacterium]